MSKGVLNSSNPVRDSCKFYVAFLAVTWIAGFLSGIVISNTVGTSVSSLMRMSMNTHVSIVSVLFASFLPFLFSTAAILLSKIWLFFPVCFVTSFSYAYTLNSIICCFGVSGWAIQILFMLTDGIAAVVMLWFWLRFISKQCALHLHDAAICMLFLAGTAAAECYLISPLLASIIQ